MRIVLCGQRSFGSAVLDLCIENGHELALVCAPGATDKLFNNAESRGIPTVESLRSAFIPEDADLIIAAHSHDFISEQCRKKVRLGGIGYHPSLLPLHRGRDAIRWAVRDRDRVTGGSVYWLSDIVDGGDVAASAWCFVRPNDTASTLWERELFPMGLRLISHVLNELSIGIIRAEPQDPLLATWEPAVGKVPRLFRPELIMLGDPDSSFKIERKRALL